MQTSIRQTASQVRSLLLIAFGGLLFLLAVLGLRSFSLLRDIQKREAAVRNDFLRRDQVLDQLRTAIYLSGTHVRDLILEPNPARAAGHRTDLENEHAQIERLMADYRDLLRPDERQPFEQLRKQTEFFFAGIAPALSWSAEQRRSLGFNFMRDLLMPRRSETVDLATQLRRINDSQLAVNSRQVDQLFRDFRERFLLLLSLILLVGMLLAAISFYRILRLERERNERFAESVNARTALRDLSTRLLEVQETERKALSRELHDEVGQALSGVLLGIANVTAMLAPQDDQGAFHELQKLKRLTERTVATVRDMSLLLRPSMLDDLGLVPALQWQAREISRTTELAVTVQAESVSDDLDDAHRTCIYRIAQEALRNTVRHARASRVNIDLTQDSEGLMLTIDDNGSGFRPEREKGVGILGMEERVKHLGGSFELRSERGAGSHIQVRLPFVATPVSELV